MGKKDLLDDFWNSFLIVVLLQSLLVPWAPLATYRRPPLQNSAPSGGLTDGVAPSATGSSSGDLGRIGKGRRSLFSPWWRRDVLGGIIRTLYPDTGLSAYVLDDVRTQQPGPRAWGSALSNPSHPDGAFGPRPQQDAVESDQELSLEDSDLIDVLWRRDIDLEKGFSFVVPSPEQQHERDMQVLSEKHWTGQHVLPWTSTDQQNLFESFSKAYSDLRKAQKDYEKESPFFELSSTKEAPEDLSWFVGLDGTLSKTDPFPDKVDEPDQVRKYLEDFDKSCAHVENGEELCEGSEKTEADIVGNSCEDDVAEFFKSFGAEEDWAAPLNDICLTSAAVPDDDSTDLELNHLGQSVMETSEADLVEWAERYPSESTLSVDDLDSIRTPNLELSYTDIHQLFTDHQVTEDVIASVPTGRDFFLNDGQCEFAGGTHLNVRTPRTGSSSSDQRVPNSAYLSPFSDSEFSEVILEPGTFNGLEPSVSMKELPLSPGCTNSSNFSLSPGPLDHVAHDHAYTARTLEADILSTVSGTGGQSEEDNDDDDYTVRDSRVGGKLVPMFDFDVRDEELKYEDFAEDEHCTVRDTRFQGKLVPTLDSGFSVKDERLKFEDPKDIREKLREQSSSVSSAPGRPGRHSQDQQLVRRYGLPFEAQDLVDMPLTRFSQVVKSPEFTAEQQRIMQKIRRRGKNKEAARNCRQRRTRNLQQLEMETELLRKERNVELQTNRRLQEEIEAEELKILTLERKLKDLYSTDNSNQR